MGLGVDCVYGWRMLWLDLQFAVLEDSVSYVLDSCVHVYRCTHILVCVKLSLKSIETLLENTVEAKKLGFFFLILCIRSCHPSS